jgi:hypothetical protein
VLAVIGEPEAAWDFLSEESAFVDSENSVRPIDALRQGKVEAVVAAAHSFLEAFRIQTNRGASSRSGNGPFWPVSG